MSYEYGIVTEPSYKSWSGGTHEWGMKFKTTSSFTICGLRVKVPSAFSTTLKLWDSSGILLASTAVTTVGSAWVEGFFSSNITLTSGATYTISLNANNIYYTSSASIFNSKLSSESAVYAWNSPGTFPQSVDHAGNDGIVDIIIGELAVGYKTSGNAIFTAAGITATVATSSISWSESKPTGTTLTVSVSTDGTNYNTVTNGGALLAANTVLDNATICVKVEMATTDATVTPTLSNLAISLQSTNDTYSIVLEMQPLERFESAAGGITVAYAGGSLMGEGGAVAAFTQTFTPSDLAYKGDQNDAEHIEMSVSAVGTLTRIFYTNTAPQDMGHIEMSVTATGTLTNVNDL